MENSDLIKDIIIAIIGIVFGFLTSLFFAKFNAKKTLEKDLKRAMAEKRADSYIELWKLCSINFSSQKERQHMLNILKKWYSEGGGLLLPFKATKYFNHH